MSLTHDEFVRALQWRYAVKKFDRQKKIPPQDWMVLEESLRLSPSSYGLQPWKFLLVQNPDTRKKLTPLSWNQTQVEDCSHFLVLTVLRKISAAYVERFIASVAETRGTDLQKLEGYKKAIIRDVVEGPGQKAMDWATHQIYIAMGNIMNAAAVFGIDTCPMEGIEPEKYDEVLGLQKTDYATVAAVALGYRSADDVYQHAKKVRFPRNEVFVEL